MTYTKRISTSGDQLSGEAEGTENGLMRWQCGCSTDHSVKNTGSRRGQLGIFG
jgi:hypothetical protein